MAAVSNLSSNNSPHLNTRMSSPKDVKRTIAVKNEDNQRRESPLHNSQDARRPSPPRIEHQPAVHPSKGEPDAKPTAPSNNTTQPLAPPPRPVQNNPIDTPDYFNTVHSNTSHLQLEPNPFEQSFGNPSSETPGKLPPIANLTSPSSLLPGGTPGWPNSLRSGPLSPAMLAGPAGATDYFGDSFRGGFPTPNESSLRTGLTPGGGGSMFPAPSPNSQALFNSLASGGATPSTLDFHRTAMNAAAAAKQQNFNVTSNGPTSQPPDQSGPSGMDHRQYRPQHHHQQGHNNPFDNTSQHDNEAANSLFLLTQANGMRGTNGPYGLSQQPPNAVNNNMGQGPNQGPPQSADTSPVSRRPTKNNSIASIETGDFSDSGQSEQAKPTAKSRGKKGSTSKAQNNNRRKAEETPGKSPASKKPRNNSSAVSMANMDQEMVDMDSDEEGSPKQELGENGKKMTDEEKRKNFLERNRVAALKCRQRKKQWLANLQAKVELFTTENDHLSAQVTQLREEIVNLKTLLLAHKDCPVSQQQGLGGMAMHSFIGDPNGQMNAHANPYGMAMPPPGQPMGMPMGGQVQQGQMQRG